MDIATILSKGAIERRAVTLALDSVELKQAHWAPLFSRCSQHVKYYKVFLAYMLGNQSIYFY